MLPIILLALQAATPAAPAAAPPAPAPAPVAASAPWAIRERTDAASGVAMTSTSAIARDGSSRLTVKCDKAAESIVSVQFIAKQPLQTALDTGEFADKPVSMRFNGGPAITDTWQFRATAAYIANSTPVTALTVQLAKAKAITVETTTAGNFAFSATFDGPATSAPIVQVLTACGYKLGEVPPPPPAEQPKK